MLSVASSLKALSMVSELQVLSLGREQRCFRRWFEMSSAQEPPQRLAHMSERKI